MTFVALLPMKGHSERVPRKNLRSLGGKPLFFHITETLLSLPEIGPVVINTDSHEIADVAMKEYGDRISISWRPPELFGDDVSINRIIDYEVSRVDDLDAHFIQTHSTNPFLTANSLTSAMHLYLEQCATGKIDSLFSVTEMKSRLYRADLTPINHNPLELLRTQDLEPIYEENSNFYIFSGRSFRTNRTRIGSMPGVFPVDSLESHDIDTQADWDMAVYLHRAFLELR